MSTVDFTGTVSEGTMRARDLVPAFMDVLAKYAPDVWLRIKSDIASEFNILNYDCLFGLDGECNQEGYCGHCLHNDSPGNCTLDRDDVWYSEMMSWILNEDIWDAMNDITPDGCYFGAHPGDGSDYGFWQVEEDY